jgi:chromosomal replication initiator protein
MSNENENLTRVWAKVCAKFSFTSGVSAFNSWLKPLEISGFDAGVLTIKAPSRFIKDWVNSNFGKQLENLVREEIPSLLGIDILVGETKNYTATEQHLSAIEEIQNNSRIINQPAMFECLTDQRFKFGTFATGDSNSFAYNAARSIAEGTNLGANTLFIYGSVGSGKTHLLQSVANHVKENFKGKRALYLSAERFMFQFVKALREKDMLSFKDFLRSTDILLIDDIQFICGKFNVQEEFIHTFNAVVENGKQIVLSANCAPSDLKDIDERIKSRLGCGLVADIKKPDLALRLDILKLKAALLNTEVSNDVLTFLAENINTNVRELEGALIKISAQSKLSGRAITKDFATESLKDLLRGARKELTIDEIKRIVCNQFEIKISDIESSRRDRSISRPRQVAMYLAKNLTTKSLPEIGRNFGSKNHTTVIHAIKTIEKLKASQPEMDNRIESLTRMLAS